MSRILRKIWKFESEISDLGSPKITNWPWNFNFLLTTLPKLSLVEYHRLNKSFKITLSLILNLNATKNSIIVNKIESQMLDWNEFFYLWDELGDGVGEDPEHGGGVGVEEGHPVGQFGADFLRVSVVAGAHSLARDRPSVVAEVILDRRSLHLQIINPHISKNNNFNFNAHQFFYKLKMCHENTNLNQSREFQTIKIILIIPLKIKAKYA